MRLLVTLFALLICELAFAQGNNPYTKLVKIKAGNNQKDSSFVNIDISQKQPILLKYNQNYVQFYFINSKDATNKSFSYSLDGLDYSWITCDNCSEVVYAHLDGGDYTFQIKTMEPGDVPLKFSFSIAGNVLHKWWFVPMLFLYFLIFAGVAIYLFVLYEFRQKIRHQALIHKEKLNSMGELTAGVAHEIQNPLNFVNNFSDLSIDLVKELEEEMNKPDPDKALINDLTEDIKSNQEKINHYGKRASDIVKGMLEHSKKSFTEKTLTDINALCGESTKLALNNFKAKNENFDPKIELNLDPSLPKIYVVSQDVSRVILNLINNAFYAVNERANQENEDGRKETGSSNLNSPNSDLHYIPTVTIITQLKPKNQLQISIKDNGPGIPDTIKEKIFQPFFTTKPTGQGTGLGLSLAYDIVKVHGGELKVESNLNSGTKFHFNLPL